LCGGKSGQLKEMYEKGDQDSSEVVPDKERMLELEELRLEKAKRLREMFEKGEVVRGDDDDDGVDDMDGKKSVVEKESAVFESGVAKQSRSLFQQMDMNLAKSASAVSVAPVRTPIDNTKILQRQVIVNSLLTLLVAGNCNVGDGQTLFERGEVVRSSDQAEDVLPSVKTEDLSSKFKFFETYEKQLEEAKSKRKESFRITPPREEQVGRLLWGNASSTYLTDECMFILRQRHRTKMVRCTGTRRWCGLRTLCPTVRVSRWSSPRRRPRC
jgi:hypothetical protein